MRHPEMKEDGWCDAGFARFDAASEAALTGALANGRGVVLAASHTGNWELAAAAIAEACALSAVTKRIHSQSIDAFMRGARGQRLHCGS